jgi:hypothetical protein
MKSIRVEQRGDWAEIDRVDRLRRRSCGGHLGAELSAGLGAISRMNTTREDQLAVGIEMSAMRVEIRMSVALR